MRFFYSLHRSDAHPDLHSFPTRRSSDLDPLDTHMLAVVEEPEVGDEGLDQEDATRAQAAGHVGEAAHLVVLGQQRDRKSTRLNSSHVRISYAVFCLKKKKRCDEPVHAYC